VNSVFCVWCKVRRTLDRLQENTLRGFAYTEHRKRLIGFIMEKIPDKVPVYIALNQTVKPKFNGFQSHALQGNSEVNVDVPVFRNGSIDDNECGSRFGPRRFTEKDFAQRSDIIAGNKPVTQRLTVHCRSDSRIHFDNGPQLLRRDMGILLVTPHGAVLDQ